MQTYAIWLNDFTHSVKKGNSNAGVRGKIGRRGDEGEPDYCNFCKPIGKMELQELLTKSDDFKNYMRSAGKLGGQNKVPRLSNDRKIVDQLTLY